MSTASANLILRVPVHEGIDLQNLDGAEFSHQDVPANGLFVKSGSPEEKSLETPYPLYYPVANQSAFVLYHSDLSARDHAKWIYMTYGLTIPNYLKSDEGIVERPKTPDWLANMARDFEERMAEMTRISKEHSEHSAKVKRESDEHWAEIKRDSDESWTKMRRESYKSWAKLRREIAEDTKKSNERIAEI